MTPRFRPTVWPGGEIPLPQIPVRDVRELGDGWLLLHGPTRYVEAPADFYLREMGAHAPVADEAMGANVTTDEAVVEFVRQWGRCSDPDYRDRPNGQTWAEFEIDPRLQNRYGPDVNLSFLRAKVGRKAKVTDWHNLVHVEEVKDRLRTSRWLAQHLRHAQEEEPTEDMWELFGEQINAALSAYQVRVSTPSGVSVVLPHVTAFSVSALQLLNDLALDTPLRHCGNERCPFGGVFTRQRGRAQYGQHRTAGIKYCSNSCAKAQGERERRRRQTRGAGQ